MFKEDTQDLKFILGQLDDFPFIHQVRRLEIKDSTPVLQQILIRAKFVRAAQEPLDLGKENILVKGLGDKVVSTHIDGHNNIHGLIP